MKKLLLTGLVVLPGLTFAGGTGNVQSLDMYERAKNAQTQTKTQPTTNTVTSFGSTEAPKSILASRKVTGSTNENYMKYSFDLIPETYWKKQSPEILDEVNGFIELEEYFGQTNRADFEDTTDSARENERQQRAQAKALRLRTLYQ